MYHNSQATWYINCCLWQLLKASFASHLLRSRFDLRLTLALIILVPARPPRVLSATSIILQVVFLDSDDRRVTSTDPFISLYYPPELLANRRQLLL